MTLSIQEISDRMEINDLIIDYSTAVDSGQIDDFDNIFTADAFIDYTAMGGIKGNLEEIKAYLKGVVSFFPATQHMIANSRIRIDHDTAMGRIMCHNPMVFNLADGGKQTAYYGLWYVDKYIRTDAGWRIQERVEEHSYEHNVPANFEPLPAETL
jgi:hypothetical protein